MIDNAADPYGSAALSCRRLRRPSRGYGVRMAIRRALPDPAAELAAMVGLAERVWTPRTRWHLGDLTWSRLQFASPVAYPAAAWWEDGEVVAWGRVPAPGHMEMQVDPARPDMAGVVLDWVESLPGHAGEPLTATILDTETHIADELARRGYGPVEESRFFIHLIHDLVGLSSRKLPAGYRLRHVVDEADAEGRARAHVAAFGAPSAPLRVTSDSYRNVMTSPFYRRSLDWLVEYDDDVVAFCLGWWSRSTRSLCLEPVGCHPEHRRRGLASAAINAVLETAVTMGATIARVCARGDDRYPSARSLYRDVGFVPVGRNRSWKRSG